MNNFKWFELENTNCYWIIEGYRWIPIGWMWRPCPECVPMATECSPIFDTVPIRRRGDHLVRHWTDTCLPDGNISICKTTAISLPSFSSFGIEDWALSLQTLSIKYWTFKLIIFVLLFLRCLFVKCRYYFMVIFFFIWYQDKSGCKILQK